VTDGHRRTDRDRGLDLSAAHPVALPVTRIVLGTEGVLSSIGSVGIGSRAVRALLVRLGRGLTGEAA
jgi:hypothetical protein